MIRDLNNDGDVVVINGRVGVREIGGCLNINYSDENGCTIDYRTEILPEDIDDLVQVLQDWKRKHEVRVADGVVAGIILNS